MNLAELARDWTRLGEQDPLWAVYVAPDTRGGGWDVEQFLALGRRRGGRSLRATARAQG